MIRKLWVLACPPVFLLLLEKIRGWVNRKSATHRLRDARRLHLGCGSNVIAGWSNVDFSAAHDVVGVDLTKPIPATSGSIELIFSEHFIEHISQSDGERFLAECYRLLKPGGVLRISTPDLRKLIKVYFDGNVAEWSDVGWNPKTPCAMINEGLRSWGHLFVYDEVQLMDGLKKSGFVDSRRVSWHASSVSGLSNLECRPFHDDLIIEATKPA